MQCRLVTCDVMGICLLVLITAAMVVCSHIQEEAATVAYQICRHRGETFDCNSSLILITKMTNQTKEADMLFFENLKRECMGKSLCNTSRLCQKHNWRQSTVHYMCIEVTYIRSRLCNRHSQTITHNFGYIQSAGYPGPSTGDMSCRWTIDVPDNKAVVILIHDFVITKRQNKCETRLAITGTSCPGDLKEPDHFCGQDNITSLTRCGQTQITFLSSEKNYNGRYWLSFCVLQRDQMSSFSRYKQHCPIPNHDENYGQGSKDASGENSQDSNTEVLVIMLSIISGISAVLFAILIVVCVRCRLVQSPGAAESVYSDPSPASVHSYQRPNEQPHYEYVSTSDVENVRPHLTDGYCEVADALPFAQRSEPPTSPPYAEVEHTAEIRNVAHLISSDEYPRTSKRGQRPRANGIKNNEDNQGDNNNANPGSSQTEPRGILGAFKDTSSKKRYANTASNTGQQNVHNSVEKETKHKRTTVTSQKMLNTESNSDNDSSTYETIGRTPPVKIYVQSKERKHPDSGEVPSVMSQRSVLVTENCSEKLQEVVDDNANSTATSDSCSNTHSHTSDHTYYVLERRKKTMGLGGKSKPKDNRARSKSLPSSKSATCLSDSDVRKQHRRTAPKDIPPASGIVRNGIMKFEQNSA